MQSEAPKLVYVPTQAPAPSLPSPGASFMPQSFDIGGMMSMLMPVMMMGMLAGMMRGFSGQRFSHDPGPPLIERI